MLVLFAMTLVACTRAGGSDVAATKKTTPQTDQTQEEEEVWIQVERLARPAINEGLILTNAYLEAFNSISPDLDLSDAAAPVRAEAVAVLGLLNSFSANLGITTAPSPGVVAGGFLPDVMRIDTSVDMTPQTTAYNADFVLVDGNPMLTGGRKIEDDVMDITLSYLLAGDPSGGSIGDGVTYAGAAGANCQPNDSLPNQPGHRCLVGQTTRKGSARFPFLAIPL